MRISDDQDVVLGPPGTGKSTYLLNDIDKKIEQGESPDRIAFVSFTKKAVEEATDRAAEKFKLKPRQLPLFKTIHSLCFAGLGISKKDVVGKEHLKELGEWLGYRFEGTWEESEQAPAGSELGDTLMFLDNLARITRKSLLEVWENNHTLCEWAELERFQEGYETYKSSNMVMDFTDMLYGYVAMCDPSPARQVYIDEAQDLSAAQWMVLKHAFGNVQKTTIAGDDDQSIYEWSGADVNTFMSLEGHKRILSQSYRLPKAVHNLSQILISKVNNRYDKQFSSRGEEGEVNWFQNIDDMELADERTMFLVRNVHLVPKAAEYLYRKGIPFVGKQGYSSIRRSHVNAIYAVEALRKHEPIKGSDVKDMYDAMRVGYYLERGFKTKVLIVKDNDLFTFTDLCQNYGLKDIAVWYECLEGIPQATRDYYRLVLSNGYNLRATPNYSINTIHGVKGGEADHVILFSDMANKSFLGYEQNPDSERRVAYVGITRSKNRLSIIQPKTRLYFPYYEECN